MTASTDSGFEVALVAEATRKAGLIWLAYGDEDEERAPRPAWHAWHEDAAYVVLGPGEQSVPGLEAATRATVVVPSKDTHARVVSWPARVEVVPVGSERWQPAAAVLAGGRLNAEGGAAMIARWARDCTIVRLVPDGAPTERADEPSNASLAAQPRATPATTLGRQPKMLGGLRRRPR